MHSNQRKPGISSRRYFLVYAVLLLVLIIIVLYAEQYRVIPLLSIGYHS
jgi:hypothetical protein